MTKVNVIGSGGHARSVIAIALQNAIEVAGVYDNSFVPGRKEEIFPGLLLKGKIADVPSQLPVILAVGDNSLRKSYFEELNIFESTLTHQTAFIDPTVTPKSGNIFFGNSFVNAKARIGRNNIINTRAIIEHECTIGDHNHISVNSVLCGRVNIGNLCFVGASATILDNIEVCDNAIIGAGAVVTKSIKEPGVYIGIPARRIR